MSDTATELGFAEIRAALAARARTPLGRQRAEGLEFLENAEAIEVSLGRVEEIRGLLREGEPLPLADISDVTELAARAQRGAALSGEEVWLCARVLRSARDVRRFVGARDHVPLLAQLAVSLPDAAGLLARVELALEPSGTLRDEASDFLADHRRRLRALHGQARQRVEEMLHDPQLSSCLQDNYFSVRNERYVLPVRASHRARVPGIVHNASQTGLTLFIEPTELVDLGNELAISESLVAEEEQRILAELSEATGEHMAEIATAVSVLGACDLLQAAAHLADAMDAEPVEVARFDAPVELLRLRHPLLVLQDKEVVPNDVHVAGAGCGMIISGPNAGGKTVTLSAVGLAALLLRAGLPVPAARGSRLPLYRGVASAIGDAQDLRRDLSTFTAQLQSLSEMLTAAEPGWLLLIDEVGADTDPKEGAALACAVLEALVDRRATVMATTHLDGVKALGLEDERFTNARVGFDPDTLAPTYRLELGAAGTSCALNIARRAGLPPEVLERAEVLLSGEDLLGAALARLQREEHEATREQHALQQARVALEEEHRAVAAERAQLAESRRRAEAKVREELLEELTARRDEVGRLIKELQQKPEMRRAQRAQRRLHEIEAEQARAQERLSVTSAQQGREDLAAVGVGSWVRILPLGKDGRVLSSDGKTAVVEVGALRTRARLTDLVALAAAPKAAKSVRPRGAAEVIRYASERCDLRGLRADEASLALETFLDHHYLEGPSTVTVVHGLGTGVLKQVVREALARSPYVSSFRAGADHEGGDGVTVVDLKSD